MKPLSMIVAVFLVLVFALPVLAENQISCTASDAGSGLIKVTGTVTVDSGYEIQPGGRGVAVEVWKDGEEVTYFDGGLKPDKSSFEGTSEMSYSAGTYNVMVWVEIGPVCCGPYDSYAYVTTVTIK
ncbi:MAG: hypothetical protein L0Y72_09130 [Gemmataceae bacterium]|nr:hypothetical protein [Gemmataceae bacterium]MCI0739194.1 hypothetical protein [Gemmataceae bacterium]